jgi:hypothetical protein
MQLPRRNKIFLKEVLHMRHHVKTIRRVLRRERRAKIMQMDSDGNQQSLEWSETEILHESTVEHDLSSDPSRLLEVELADRPSSAPSESSQVEQTDDSSPQKGFLRKLWEKIESNLIWDLIKCLFGAMVVWMGLIFPQLKAATLEKAAASTIDYMANVLANIHVVLSSLF